MKIKYNLPECMGDSKCSLKRKVYSHEGIYKMAERFQINDLNYSSNS
jgi:hypothetical protein